eukprot:TRINITY_DN14061_c0_g2_i3.p1 TRINITY_DN14061_c0_g2~~TRINITY_DN14061_c0_g2_i3.p1  ORF type:complete len:739 (-),score=177.79 TRINITY_DN14061_c0_g2_i3:32-2146(-)
MNGIGAEQSDSWKLMMIMPSVGNASERYSRVVGYSLDLDSTFEQENEVLVLIDQMAVAYTTQRFAILFYYSDSEVIAQEIELESGFAGRQYFMESPLVEMSNFRGGMFAIALEDPDLNRINVTVAMKNSSHLMFFKLSGFTFSFNFSSAGNETSAPAGNQSEPTTLEPVVLQPSTQEVVKVQTEVKVKTSRVEAFSQAVSAIVCSIAGVLFLAQTLPVVIQEILGTTQAVPNALISAGNPSVASNSSAKAPQEMKTQQQDGTFQQVDERNSTTGNLQSTPGQEAASILNSAAAVSNSSGSSVWQLIDFLQFSAMLGCVSCDLPQTLSNYLNGMAWTIGGVVISGFSEHLSSSQVKFRHGSDSGLFKFAKKLNIPPEYVFPTVFAFFLLLGTVFLCAWIVIALFFWFAALCKRSQSNERQKLVYTVLAGAFLRLILLGYSGLLLTSFFQLQNASFWGLTVLAVLSIILCFSVLIYGVVRVRTLTEKEAALRDKRILLGGYFTDYLYLRRLYFINTKTEKLVVCLIMNFVVQNAWAQFVCLVVSNATSIAFLHKLKPYALNVKQKLQFFLSSIRLVQLLLTSFFFAGKTSEAVGIILIVLNVVTIACYLLLILQGVLLNLWGKISSKFSHGMPFSSSRKVQEGMKTDEHPAELASRRRGGHQGSRGDDEDVRSPLKTPGLESQFRDDDASVCGASEIDHLSKKQNL